MTRQRRRGLLLVSLALASGGLSASEVSSRTRAVEERTGPLVPVVAARVAIEPGTKLGPDKLTVVEVPARYAPPDALADPAQADGLRTAGALERGSYVTTGAFGGPDEDQPGNGLGRGERAIELKVAGADALGDLAGPGARVDVLITSESGDNSGRTALALEDVELLAIRPGGGGVVPGGPNPGDAAPGAATATLRVTLKQAVYLTAAQNFARETRLLPRSPGDRRRSGRLEADGAGL